MDEAYSFCEKGAPEHMPGDTVWPIQGPRPIARPACVNGVECVLVHEGRIPRLIAVGYRLDAIYWDGTFWPRHAVHASKGEAERLCRWTEVNGVTDEEWQRALGSREDNSHYNSELVPCCSWISDVRDILYQCREHHGLPLRDIEIVKENILTSHPEMLDCLDDMPALKKILNKLKLEDVEVDCDYEN